MDAMAGKKWTGINGFCTGHALYSAWYKIYVHDLTYLGLRVLLRHDQKSSLVVIGAQDAVGGPDC